MGVISFTHRRYLWTTNSESAPPTPSNRQLETEPGRPRSKRKDRQPQHPSNWPAMRSVAVLRYGNRLGPHPTRLYTRRVRIAGHATGGTDELPGKYAPPCRLAVQLSTQTNGKVERWHQSLKSECIRPLTPLTLEDARRLIQSYVDRYNHVRLHSAIGYVTPHDMLLGRQAEIHTARDRKLEQARKQRQLRRRQALAPRLLASSELQYPRQVKRKRGYAGTQPC